MGLSCFGPARMSHFLILTATYIHTYTHAHIHTYTHTHTHIHTHTYTRAEKIVVVNTDSKVTLDTLQNRNKHYILIENIRKEIKTYSGQCFSTG